MIKRCAGVLIPLFSLHTADDLGRGDIGGLLPMAELALAMGQRLIQLLPIDELAPGETSPYSALSVFAIDPVYSSVRDLPGIDTSLFEAARHELVGSGTPADQLGLRATKAKLLEQAYRYFQADVSGGTHADFDQFVRTNQDWLEDYALFRALKEKFGGISWERWPDGFKQRQAAAMAESANALADRIAMFKYFQFVAHRQWLGARTQLQRRGVMIGGDLAFSPGRESAEVWAHPELFDLTRSVGAPPDNFSLIGQRWGLPMPDWQRMRASGFEFIRTRVRHARDLYDALRVDHVVGLFRTYSYPVGAEIGGSFDPALAPAQRAQGEEILRVILKEAGSMRIIAEDLGVIPAFVRASLATLGIPGYKVLRWETEKLNGGAERVMDPAAYPIASLATTGTHDTETLCEWWATVSEDERRAFAEGLRILEADWRNSRLDEPTLDAILHAIYASPAELAILPMQDLFGWEARINTPGTVSNANWTWRLPFELERTGENEQLRARIEKIRTVAERTGRFEPG
jgi:4-alpha-glucanotransferase